MPPKSPGDKVVVFEAKKNPDEPFIWSYMWSVIKELKQKLRRRLPKRHLKKWIRVALNFIALIPPRLIRQILAKTFGVDF